MLLSLDRAWVSNSRGAIAALPGAFADVVTNGHAEQAVERVLPGQMSCGAADDTDQFAFVLDALRGVGWVRSLSGVQSLVCVYLLALSAFTYFGRPFE